MSKFSWKKQLSEKLKHPARRHKLHLAIVGIGAELNGDDAVGIYIARKLKAGLELHKEVIVLEGGPLPESFSGPLRVFSPELVILIDAADFGGRPGEIRWIDMNQILGGSFSTHSMPLSLLAEYLTQETGCQVMILGIQPAALEFGTPMTQECERAVDEVIAEFKTLMNERVRILENGARK